MPQCIASWNGEENISNTHQPLLFITASLRSKGGGGACAIPRCASACACARARDQYVQFLRLGQFLSNYKG